MSSKLGLVSLQQKLVKQEYCLLSSFAKLGLEDRSRGVLIMCVKDNAVNLIFMNMPGWLQEVILLG